MTTAAPDDIFAPEVIADPYAYYSRLRETDPVHFNERYGTWLITRYADVAWMLRHPELFSSEFYKREPRPPSPPIHLGDEPCAEFVAEYRTAEIIQNDPPEHRRLRSVFQRWFSPAQIAHWRGVVADAVGSLLDAAEARGRLDIVDDVARPLPLLVISEMLGVPTTDRVMLKEQAEERMASALDLGPARMRRAAVAIHDSCAYFDRLLEGHDGEDLLGLMLAAEHSGRYTRTESLANAQGLLDAGHETTIQLICNGVLAFMRHRDQWEEFLGDADGLAETATEECLRYDSPLPGPRRVAAADVELGGARINTGDRVIWVIAAANRDPLAFSHPDRFDIRRDPNRHLAFGAGIHYCLGQYLARMEGQEVFKALARRYPALTLKNDDVAYAALRGVRSIKTLPVNCH